MQKQTLIKVSVIFTSFKSVPHNVDVLLSRAHLILSLGFGRLVFKKLVKATTFSEHEQEQELLDSESELELESESESESELDIANQTPVVRKMCYLVKIDNQYYMRVIS